jgi:hypothetical protein
MPKGTNHWTPKVTLGGSDYLIEEQNGLKGPNLDVSMTKNNN